MAEEWKAAIQRYKVTQSRTWVPLPMYVGRELYEEFSAPYLLRVMDIKLKLPGLPDKSALGIRYTGKDAVTTFGFGEYSVKGLEGAPIVEVPSFKIEVWLPVPNREFTGIILGEMQ